MSHVVKDYTKKKKNKLVNNKLLYNILVEVIIS